MFLCIICAGDYMKNYLVKAYAMHEGVRIYAAITTGIVDYVQQRFNMWPTSTAALGRVLTMAAIMSSTYKNDDYLNIYVNGDGPIGKITCEAHDGKVRGFCQNPGVYLSHNNGKLDVASAVGSGFIEVVKDLHLREPFSSTSEIISGEIAEDFTYYFAKSEQIPSSVGLGVLVDPDGKVASAGGFLIQVMPGCKDEDITKLEEKLKTLKSCSKMINDGYTALDIINEITDGDYEFLEEKELSYECNCSKERFERGLISLGKTELLDILNTDKKIEINCNFCNKHYEFNAEEIQKLAEEAK